jgi:hypothetical protein
MQCNVCVYTIYYCYYKYYNCYELSTLSLSIIITISWYICMCDCVCVKIIRTVIVRANTPYHPHPFYAVHLGTSNVRLYIQLGRSTRVFREYKFPTPVKLLHSLKIFNKGLILPPPLNFYIRWRSSIRDLKVRPGWSCLMIWRNSKIL